MIIVKNSNSHNKKSNMYHCTHHRLHDRMGSSSLKTKKCNNLGNNWVVQFYDWKKFIVIALPSGH